MKTAMTSEQRSQIALRLLADAEREFASGEIDRAPEKFWDAATGVVAAVAEQLGWRYKSDRDLKNSVERIASQSGNNRLAVQYSAIQMFYMRVRYDLGEDFQLDSCRATVHRFVEGMLAILQDRRLLMDMRQDANTLYYGDA